MSKIDIFAMGGLNETGRNTYVIEVDNNIFVFDLGLKFPPESTLGVEYILPDYEYLIKNRKKIKGIFLTNSLPESSGGVFDLVKLINDVDVYASKYTYEMLLLNKFPKKNLKLMEAHKPINFGKNLSVFPIRVNNSNPESLMLVLNTPDGAICYTSNYLIDSSMMGPYHMDLGKIAYVGKKGVLAYLSDSTFAEKVGFSSPNHHLVSPFKKAINKSNGRVIFSAVIDHLYTIEGILAAANAFNRKVVLMGKELQNIVEIAYKNKYINVPKKVIGNLNDLKDKNSIILITDSRDNPYFNINKIIEDKDKYVKLEETDTVYFAEPKYDEYEKTRIDLLNKLAIKGVNIDSIPEDKEVLQHASSEDIMVMTSMLNPKYFIPVRGEYRYMVASKDIAEDLGYKEDEILLKQNGEVITINNKKLTKTKKFNKIDDVLIDGSSTEDLGDLVLKDREVLSEHGIVLINATIDKQTKKIISGPEITTRGFIYIRDSRDLMNEIKEMSEKIIIKNVFPKYIDFATIRNEIRSDLGRFFYKETQSKPMIIAVIQEV